jgi:hypothetical protein
MRVCLIAEKSSLGLQVLPIIDEMHPDLDQGSFTCAFVNPYVHLNSRFRYPRGLSFHDYPFTGEPAYEPFAFGSESSEIGPHFLPKFGFRIDRSTQEPESRDPSWRPASWVPCVPALVEPYAESIMRLRAADVVYAAVDPGPSSMLALDRCLAALGLCDRRVAIPHLTSLSHASLVRAFRNAGHPGDEAYEDSVARGRLRRRFDYGYQVNAQAVHGRTLRLAGAARDARVPSKYGLQILYAMRRHGPTSEGLWVDAMDRWKGTGRYDLLRNEWGNRVGMAGLASRHVILQELQASGLATKVDPREVGISELGERFLDFLHPDSEDTDLPFRLEVWKGEADGSDRIDRYLRTFFGRQIRYQAVEMARSPGTPVHAA